MWFKKLVGIIFFKITGWTFDKDFAWYDKQIVVGFPHTTNMDGVRTLFMFPILGIKPYALIKKELFRWPFSCVIRYFGGVPVDRSKRTNLVDQIAKEFEQHEKFTLLIAPEGTRAKKDTSKKEIKTGFWYMAKAANVPIILMVSDAKQKKGSVLGVIHPNDITEDLEQLKAIYGDKGVEVILPDLAKS